MVSRSRRASNQLATLLKRERVERYAVRVCRKESAFLEEKERAVRVDWRRLDWIGLDWVVNSKIRILGGILYVRGNAEHEASIAAAGITAIDLVVLNLYAFEATVASGGSFETCVENASRGRVRPLSLSLSLAGDHRGRLSVRQGGSK